MVVTPPSKIPNCLRGGRLDSMWALSSHVAPKWPFTSRTSWEACGLSCFSLFCSTAPGPHRACSSCLRDILASQLPVPIQSIIIRLWQEGEHTALYVPTPTHFSFHQARMDTCRLCNRSLRCFQTPCVCVVGGVSQPGLGTSRLSQECDATNICELSPSVEDRSPI